MDNTSKHKHLYFPAKIKNKYGDNIISDLHKVMNDDFCHLTYLSSKYGFSREYARQLFNKYFRTSYTNVLSRKKNSKSLAHFHSVHNPEIKIKHYKTNTKPFKGAIIECLTMSICRSLGFSIKIDPKFSLHCVDLIINNLRCEVKSSYKPWENKTDSYYRFLMSEKQKALVNFVICYIVPLKEFYIIPNTSISDKTILIPMHKPSHKYSEFKEAWHLLKQFLEGRGLP